MRIFLTLLMLMVQLFAMPSFADQNFITLASTTSTQNSGLYDFILPRFTAASGIKVRVIAVGTGQAIKLAERGDADVLLVHHRSSEERFIADKYGVERFDVMYNDFVFIGPPHDPAHIGTAPDLKTLMQRLNDTKHLFISRGDESGTHKREKNLWRTANITPQGSWYQQIGSGMGAALNMASVLQAYTLSDRGTWLAFGNKGDLEIIFSGDKKLHNFYAVIAVNPQRHPHVKYMQAKIFIDWLLSKNGQKAISKFCINGAQIFYPNAGHHDTIDENLNNCVAHKK